MQPSIESKRRLFWSQRDSPFSTSNPRDIQSGGGKTEIARFVHRLSGRIFKRFKELQANDTHVWTRRRPSGWCSLRTGGGWRDHNACRTWADFKKAGGSRLVRPWRRAFLIGWDEKPIQARLHSSSMASSTGFDSWARPAQQEGHHDGKNPDDR